MEAKENVEEENARNGQPSRKARREPQRIQIRTSLSPFPVSLRPPLLSLSLSLSLAPSPSFACHRTHLHLPIVLRPFFSLVRLFLVEGVVSLSRQLCLSSSRQDDRGGRRWTAGRPCGANRRPFSARLGGVLALFCNAPDAIERAGRRRTRKGTDERGEKKKTQKEEKIKKSDSSSVRRQRIDLCVPFHVRPAWLAQDTLLYLPSNGPSRAKSRVDSSADPPGGRARWAAGTVAAAARLDATQAQKPPAHEAGRAAARRHRAQMRTLFKDAPFELRASAHPRGSSRVPRSGSPRARHRGPMAPLASSASGSALRYPPLPDKPRPGPPRGCGVPRQSTTPNLLSLTIITSDATGNSRHARNIQPPSPAQPGWSSARRSASSRFSPPTRPSPTSPRSLSRREGWPVSA